MEADLQSLPGVSSFIGPWDFDSDNLAVVCALPDVT